MSGDKQPEPGRAGPGTSQGLRFDDPREIRALAHPARTAIIDALASGDELTATDCATLTGLSPSATAYHLKILERFGFAEPAPARADGRHRPWRATGRQLQVNLDTSTPAGAAASAAVVAAQLDTARALALQFTESSHAEPPRWRDAASLYNTDLWLTVEEVEAIRDRLEAVLQPYRERTGAGERPEGSRRCRVLTMIGPHSLTQPARPADSGESPAPASPAPESASS